MKLMKLWQIASLMGMCAVILWCVNFYLLGLVIDPASGCEWKDVSDDFKAIDCRAKIGDFVGRAGLEFGWDSPRCSKQFRLFLFGTRGGNEFARFHWTADVGTCLYVKE